MTKLGSELVRGYMKRLDRATRGIPEPRRGEFRAEIEKRLEQAIPADASESEAKAAVKRFGSPWQIADSECGRLGNAIPSWRVFALWAVIGAVAAVGLIVFPPLDVVPIFIGIWLAVDRPALRRSGFGLLTGIGLTLLYVAYLQRHGPGTVCYDTETVSGCDEYLNPWPWFLGGVAFVLSGVYFHLRKTRPAPEGAVPQV